jgi:hypothetical protein
MEGTTAHLLQQSPLLECQKKKGSLCHRDAVGRKCARFHVSYAKRAELSRAPTAPLSHATVTALAAVSRPRLDHGLGLHRGYPFVYIKSLPPKLKLRVEIDLLCHRPVHGDRGLGPWSCRHGPHLFQ